MQHEQINVINALIAHMQANVQDSPDRVQALIAAYELLAPHIDQLRDEQPHHLTETVIDKPFTVCAT